MKTSISEFEILRLQLYYAERRKSVQNSVKTRNDHNLRETRVLQSKTSRRSPDKFTDWEFNKTKILTLKQFDIANDALNIVCCRNI